MSNPRFERNLGFVSAAEQGQLENASVAIAGAGGDGGMLAVQLARMGVGELRLADPDPFEIENCNRQAVCTDRTVGTNKAEAIADYVQDINPDMKVQVLNRGIQPDNVAEFVDGATLLVDETEFTMHHLGIMLAREARKQNIPNMTALNMGFGAIVTTYKPGGTTVENRLGFGDTQDIDEIAKAEVDIARWLPYLPKYGDLDVLKKVATGEKSAPSIAPGVAIAAGTAASQAFLNIVGRENHRPAPVYAPKALVVDPMSGLAKVIKYNRRSHYKHLLPIVGRNLLKLNPQASY